MRPRPAAKEARDSAWRSAADWPRPWAASSAWRASSGRARRAADLILRQRRDLQGTTAGFSAYLNKPVRRERLRRGLATVLGTDRPSDLDGLVTEDGRAAGGDSTPGRARTGRRSPCLEGGLGNDGGQGGGCAVRRPRDRGTARRAARSRGAGTGLGRAAAGLCRPSGPDAPRDPLSGCFAERRSSRSGARRAGSATPEGAELRPWEDGRSGAVPPEQFDERVAPRWAVEWWASSNQITSIRAVTPPG